MRKIRRLELEAASGKKLNSIPSKVNSTLILCSIAQQHPSSDLENPHKSRRNVDSLSGNVACFTNADMTDTITERRTRNRSKLHCAKHHPKEDRLYGTRSDDQFMDARIPLM
ncbi:MAG: hypothetical protein IPL23_25665 [Saprospiraceae bacterium]|nr:hypothetical protein [Saprospiraceae bacterium]